MALNVFTFDRKFFKLKSWFFVRLNMNPGDLHKPMSARVRHFQVLVYSDEVTVHFLPVVNKKRSVCAQKRKSRDRLLVPDAGHLAVGSLFIQ